MVNNTQRYLLLWLAGRQLDGSHLLQLRGKCTSNLCVPTYHRSVTDACLLTYHVVEAGGQRALLVAGLLASPEVVQVAEPVALLVVCEEAHSCFTRRSRKAAHNNNGTRFGLRQLI